MKTKKTKKYEGKRKKIEKNDDVDMMKCIGILTENELHCIALCVYVCCFS